MSDVHDAASPTQAEALVLDMDIDGGQATFLPLGPATRANDEPGTPLRTYYALVGHVMGGQTRTLTPLACDPATGEVNVAGGPGAFLVETRPGPQTCAQSDLNAGYLHEHRGYTHKLVLVCLHGDKEVGGELAQPCKGAHETHAIAYRRAPELPPYPFVVEATADDLRDFARRSRIRWDASNPPAR